MISRPGCDRREFWREPVHQTRNDDNLHAMEMSKAAISKW
jgi:hypothetical protein